jgi:hypothetical protein
LDNNGIDPVIVIQTQISFLVLHPNTNVSSFRHIDSHDKYWNWPRWLIVVNVKSSFRTFYDRHHSLVKSHGISGSQLTTDIYVLFVVITISVLSPFMTYRMSTNSVLSPFMTYHMSTNCVTLLVELFLALKTPDFNITEDIHYNYHETNDRIRRRLVTENYKSISLMS